MADHRVPLLGDAWRRHEDPESSRDPHVRSVLRQLSQVAVGPAPEPTFRAELRAQLVAITPRVVAESIAAETAMVDILPRPVAAAATPRHADTRTRSRFSFGRVVGVAACVVTAFALLLGGAVVLSRKALPGDTLYGLKRASERFELATDGSDTERAGDLLSFATTRTDEARSLLQRSSATASGRGVHAGTVNESTSKLIVSALAAADSDTADASRLLSEQAVSDGSAAPLTNMTNWAPEQKQRLTALWNAMPAGPLQDAAHSSLALVEQAQLRARTLITTVTADNSCLTSTRKDTLGPTPCTDPPVTAAATPTRSGSPSTATAPTTAAGGGAASTLTPVTGTPVVAPSRGGLGSVSSPKPSGNPLPVPTNLPSVPVTVQKPSLPVSVGSCGASVSLGGVRVGVGTCGGVKVSVGP